MSDAAIRLLVPMNVEAFVVGSTAQGGPWVNLKPDFRGVFFNNYLGRQLETAPCETTTTDLYSEPGIHLHWALPDGLTHGAAGRDADGPQFPAIPNRWLILRLWDAAPASQTVNMQVTGWVLESDTITADENAAIWPQLPATESGSPNERDYYTFVGRQFEMTAWPGETAAATIDITAMGYGDPVFAAYYPTSRGILGFHDKSVAALQDVALTYLVAGWYADASKDPLQQALVTKTLDSLQTFLGGKKWTYPGLAAALAKAQLADSLAADLKEGKEHAERLQASRPDAIAELAALQAQLSSLDQQRQALMPEVAAIEESLPEQILCHGFVSGIPWKNKDTLYDTGVPRGKPFSLAVGETAVQALTALFEQQALLDAGLARLIEAFQYDLLAEMEKPGGEENVAHQIHERGFRPAARGIRWDLIQENTPPAETSTEDKAPPIPGEIRLLLANLNSRQAAINELKRQRDGKRSDLYAAWYRSVLNAADQRVEPAMLQQEIAGLQQDIDALASRIAGLEDAEGRPAGVEWERIQEALASFLPGYKLQALDEALFFRPNDPVLLLAGDAFKRSPRHGEDGRYRSDGRLLCRVSGQELTAIQVTIPFARKSDVEFGAADVDRWASLPGVKAGPRAELADLLRETLLLTLDSKRAQDIAGTAFERNEAGLAKERATEVNNLASGTLDRYLQKLWLDAANPELENAPLRYEEKDQTSSSAVEFGGQFPSPVARNAWSGNPWVPLVLQWQVTWTPSDDVAAGAPQGLSSWTLDEQGTGFDWSGDDAAAGKPPASYRGTTLLTPSASLQFSDRLRQYNRSHDSAALKEFQTAVAFMNLLCQTLGGFTDNLLARTAHLEMKPLDPGSDAGGPRVSGISDRVDDVDWLSPLPESPFLPLRAGRLKLEKLWIVDAFGQLLQLEQENGGLPAPILPDAFKAPSGEIRLQPRLAQNARLAFHWLPASRWKGEALDESPLGRDEEFDSICGWILPNFLDRGLMIYDSRGNALGALQAVQRKSWDRGAGAIRAEIESFHWIDIPGSSGFFFGKPPSQIVDPLGPDANPHLRAFVSGLLSLSEGAGQAFDSLLERLNESLGAGGGSGRNANLALLIGKPLALVRAAVELQFDGEPAAAQGWNDAQKDRPQRTAGIEALQMPLRLGDRRKWNDRWTGDDGLAGYFINRDYSRFFAAFGLEGRNDGYSTYGTTAAVSAAAPLDLTLLMDVSRGVCVTSGMLPRKIFNLPYGDVSETLENKQVIFFTGPLLSTPAAIRMPQPSDLYGQWSWTHHPEVKVWQEEPIADSQKEEARFFEDALQLSEGWLKLITSPLEIRVFKVKGRQPVREEQRPKDANAAPVPAQFTAAEGESVVLSWSVAGADGIELRQGAATLFQTSRHPLPVQYQVSVGQGGSFTLIVTDRARTTVKTRSIVIRTDPRLL